MYAILIAGLPAAGKTRFAEWLSARRKLPLISKDEIKERLFDTLGFRSREEKVRLGIAAFELLCGFAEREMLAGRDLLLENNFEDESYEPTKKLLEKYGYEAITVRFQGDIETIYSRFLDRERSPDRHPGHIRNDHYPADDPPSLTSPTLEQFAEGAVGAGLCGSHSGGSSRWTRPTLRKNFTDDERQRVRVFYCPGGFCYEKMSLKSKLMMKMFRKVLESNKNRTPSDELMIKMISSSYDISDRKYIEPIVAYLAE